MLQSALRGALLCAGLVGLSPTFLHADFRDNPYKEYERGNYKEALRMWKADSEDGDPRASYNVAMMYSQGIGVKSNPAEALSWFKKAAEQGDVDALNSLGVMYQSGDGVGRDAAQASRFYRQAAEKDHAQAQYNLGLMFLKGDGVAQNDAEAFRWLFKAATSGEPDSLPHLEALLVQKRLSQKDRESAVIRLQLAAEQGNPTAQRIMGQLYLKGELVPQSNVDAYQWFVLANLRAAEYGPVLKELEGAMTQAQVQTAKERAQQMMRSYK